jgi:hypothetical protein
MDYPRSSGGGVVRIEITIATSVPHYLKETLRRCGFTVERSGAGFGLRIGQTRLGFDEVIVRILPRESAPKDDD